MDSSGITGIHSSDLHHMPPLHHNHRVPAGPPPPPPLLPPPHEVLVGRTRGYDSPPPQISLDLNTPGREVEGLPFSGYDFLGDELLALLGNVIRSPTDPVQHEKHSQVIWQAFNDVQQDAPFTLQN